MQSDVQPNRESGPGTIGQTGLEGLWLNELASLQTLDVQIWIVCILAICRNIGRTMPDSGQVSGKVILALNSWDESRRTDGV